MATTRIFTNDGAPLRPNRNMGAVFMARPVVRYIFLLSLGLFLVYTALPTISYGFRSFAFIALLLLVANLFLKQAKAIQWQNIESGGGAAAARLVWRGLQWSYLEVMLIGGLLLYTLVLPFFTSSAVFHSGAYRGLIGTVEQGDDFSKHIAPISMEQIRIVDHDLATLLGDKVLGSQPALGSQAHLGDFTIQKVRNKLLWVAPLLHTGFFKWLNNRDGTSGYVTVSATNPRDVQLVQSVGGKPVRIKYQPEAYFGAFLTRHLYFWGYATRGITDYSFEIDDDGNPFWVVTTYHKAIGFEGNDATGVITVNPATGETKEYNVSDTPTWIDRIQPADFVASQLDDWGTYVHGFWNFSSQDKLTTTAEPILVYGENERAYWYTGLTSVGADESTVGFVLVDTRTKKAVWYKQGGATESAARTSAMGKVQEKGYYATAPIPYNINGIPTYVMCLKDKGGLVKMYAMVAISDYTVVGTGTTLQETLLAYKNAFNAVGNKMQASADHQRQTVDAVVERFAPDTKNGMCYYYFTLREGSATADSTGSKGVVSLSKSIFVGTSQISSALPLSRSGDHIRISFDDGKEDIIDITTFENLDLLKAGK